jgi:hypothetical protein
MDEIKLPQDVVNRVERRWTARFAQMPEVRQPLERRCSSPSHGSFDPLRSPQVWRLLEGSLRPPTIDSRPTFSYRKICRGPRTPDGTLRRPDGL